MGKILKLSCKTGRQRKLFKIDVDDIPIQEIEILKVRTKIGGLHSISDVCNHHMNQFVYEYSKTMKKGADPLVIHKVTVKTNLHEVTLDEYRQLLSQNLQIQPGEKLCRNCMRRLFTKGEDAAEAESHQETKEVGEPSLESATILINKSLEVLQCSPAKTVRADRATSLGKRKINDVTSKFS